MLQSKFLPIYPIPRFAPHETLDNFSKLGKVPLRAGFRPLAISLALIVCLMVQPRAQAQSANPHAVSLYNLGLSAYKQGSPESAIIFFKRAADIDPDLADAQYNLGVLYQSERRLKEAVPRFEQVLRVKPQDQDAHFQLGLALIDLGRAPEARQHFMAIAPSSSHFPEAQKRIAAIDSNPNQTPPPTTSQDNTPPLNNPPPPPPSLANPPAYTPPVNPPTQQPPVVMTPPPSVAPPPPPPPPVSTQPPVPTVPNSNVRVIATGFSAPAGLAFDKQGNLYVANFLTNTIDRIAVDGTKAPFSTAVNLKGPIGLVVDDTGNLYVANYFGGTITRINPAGISTVIATGFKKPYYLALDRDGNLFVSQQEDNSVVRITLPKATSARPH